MARIIAFGEIMLRFSPPGRELFMQSPQLQTWVAGAEANVATALARLGHDAVLVSALPHGPLGDAAFATLRGHGVDCRAIVRAAGRMGLYYVIAGAGLRASEVLYDRAHSAFADAAPGLWDWDAILAGADRLHLSGITPALGPNGVRMVVEAAEAAGRAGVPVSFDGNYRARLWESWDSDPRAILTDLVARADILFGNHRDVSLLLGRDFGGDGPDRRRAAAEAAFDAFPRLRLIASTARHVEHVGEHRITARIDARDAVAETAPTRIAEIVDRVGTGDAFAAGTLHGLARGLTIAGAVEQGLALMALKHSIPGDAAPFDRAAIDALLGGGRDVRR